MDDGGAAEPEVALRKDGEGRVRMGKNRAERKRRVGKKKNKEAELVAG